MVISRKPVTPSPGAGNGQPPVPGQLQRQESWEVYSSDEDGPIVPKPPPNKNYLPYRPPGSDHPAPLQPQAASNELPSQTNETNGIYQIPESLRPGGQRSETNPFLRKKVPDTASQPPTQQFAQLNVQTSGSGPFQPQQPQKQGTTTSSNYDTPPQTITSETNPWKTNQLDPERTYSPASATVLQEPTNEVAQPTFLQSPVDMGNPWAVGPDSTPQAPSQPPPAAPQASPQPSAVPQLFQPAQPPQPLASQAESNQWSTGADMAAPPLPPSPAPPIPAAQPPMEPLGPPFPPSPQPPPKFEPTQPPPPALFVQQATSSQPSTPGYSDTNPFAQNGSPLPPRSQSRSPAMMSVPSDEGSAFVDISQDHGKAPQIPLPAGLSTGSTSNQNPWEGLEALEQQRTGQSTAADSQIEEWKLVDVDGPAPGGTGAGESSEQPPLPPRRESGERAGFVSPRQDVDPKAETYQVKNIKWHDPASAQNPRVSPILVQNENGPCPLVALVNALTLTTPFNADDSSLVEVLRSREQISLNLLLDAVFEELMSPRRSSEDAILPDVGELYAFLMSLHTGMNVNPRFMPTAAMRDAFGRTSLTDMDAADRSNLIPGTFENTHEMGLYAAFQIPLIHGWLPSNNDPSYSALERQAPSYEDAQNILFHEEELEHKLSSPQGLSGEEQQLYQDILSIKGFLDGSATQLTAWGIQVISKAMRPGSFAILFRNDHFSTLYSHPHSKQLVTLVTDEGYRSNDQVVWESLVDIRGERTQYLSGDFQVVGQGSSTTAGGDAHAGEWQTVGNRRGAPQQQTSSDEPPLTPAEQEDRDLALAMQLQEEEDQRHREEQDRRQREQNMSTQYIEQQGRGPQPRSSSSQFPGASPSRAQFLRTEPQGIAPNRRSSASSSLHAGNSPAARQAVPRTPSQNIAVPRSPAQNIAVPRQHSQNIRPMVPPRRHVPNTHRPEATGADAPPPYEQAAHDEPFDPPPGHPAHSSSTNTSQQSATAASVTSANSRIGQRPVGQSIPAAFQGRPTPAGMGREGRDRDCIVM